MPSSLSEDYPPTLPRPQVLLVTTRVVYTQKPSTVNNVASKKKPLLQNICGSTYIKRCFSLW